jgi:hypothetical protein
MNNGSSLATSHCQKEKQYDKQALSVDPTDSLSRMTFDKICQFQKVCEKTTGKGRRAKT